MLICDTLPPVTWQRKPDFGAALAVFRVPIAASSRYLPQVQAVLHPAELLRASRYHQPADRTRFLVARSALRLLLGAYARRPPASLVFEVGVNKKPRLRHVPGLHYNISHAGDWVLIVIAHAEAGVDVEKVDAQFTFQELLAHSLSPAERAFIERGPASARLFYQLWTRKEALVKATAQGIDEAFWQVPSLDGRYEFGGGGPECGWAVSSFDVAADYAAAVAYPAALRAELAFYDIGDVVFGLPLS